MKVTTRNFFIGMAAPAFVAVSAWLVAAGIQLSAKQVEAAPAGTQSSAKQVEAAPASAESIVYFPAQYTLNAPNQVSEHIQAF
jgi:hypothetical protein